jgi:cytochrome c5
MPAQGGGDFDDVEVARGAVYMANAAGAKFAEPQRPAGAQAAASTAPAAAAAATPAPTPVAAAAPAPAAPAAQQTAAAGGANAGEALYKQTCVACHGAGVAGAPKFGDKAAWAPRIKQGLDALVQNAIKGKGAMPPKGGSSASDADMRAAVQYMVNAAK